MSEKLGPDPIFDEWPLPLTEQVAKKEGMERGCDLRGPFLVAVAAILTLAVTAYALYLILSGALYA